jgi:hypothetical protein
MFPILTDPVYLDPIGTRGRRTVTLNFLIRNVLDEVFDGFDNEGDVQS